MPGVIRKFISRLRFGGLYYAAALATLSAIAFLFLGRLTAKEPDGAGEAAYEEPLTLRLWYPWTDEEKIYKKDFLGAVDKYNKNHREMEI